MNEIFLLTGDNVKIAANHYCTGHNELIIICPGWFMTKDSRAFKSIADTLSKEFDVIVMDFRGHGKSGGFYTFTSKEDKDIDTVVQYAKTKYAKIFLMGFSLGAGLALIYASKSSDIKSVIAVSPYTNFYKIENHMWHPNAWIPTLFKKFEPLRWLTICPGNPFMKKIKPVDIIDKIKIPVLFIAGDKDKTVYPAHTKTLFNRAVCKKKLEIFTNSIHAEDIFITEPEAFITLCCNWLKD